VLIHFVVPFLVLLNRDIKKQPRRLAMVAILLLFARVGESFWQINPNFADTNGITGHFHLTLFDVVLPIAMAGIWFTVYFYQLGKRPLLPVYHHLIPEILEREHGAH
jgi:heme/copper-type cytochrome/quinol oxidase subunit 1